MATPFLSTRDSKHSQWCTFQQATRRSPLRRSHFSLKPHHQLGLAFSQVAGLGFVSICTPHFCSRFRVSKVKLPLQTIFRGVLAPVQVCGRGAGQRGAGDGGW